MPILDTKAELLIKTRAVREQFRVRGPRVKARDIALALYDGFTFTNTLTRLLIIDALMFVSRTVIQEERARSRERAGAGARAEDEAAGTSEFPGFDDICRECPSNYALPGGNPADTVYIETFDDDFTLLDKGFRYLRRHGETEIRHSTALENLYLLCRRLGGVPGETPREILARHGYEAA